ncbi:MAG: tetratricopeptide repeat protein [Gemmatimonadaceae bacterium]
MRNRSRSIAVALLALSATGCLATKGDLRLLQDELRATRASVARSDSVHRRTSDSLVATVTRLAASQTRGDQALTQAQQKTNDDLKALLTRVGANDIATKEQLTSLDDDLDQVRELVRQNMRGSAVARAQMEQAARPSAPTTPDSTAPATTTTTPVAPGTPGPATLLSNGRSMMIGGSCAAARRAFQDLLTMYPESPDAPEAQFSIGASYGECGDGGNTAKADSVYRLVMDKYPKSDWAPTSLYKRAEMQRLAGKMDVARPMYAKIVCEYPKSTVFAQALDRHGSRPVCK